MKERPIIMHARSINGILAGRKTQTRRIIRGVPAFQSNAIIRPIDDEFLLERWPKQERQMGNFGRCERLKCPYGTVGDRLWIRETWAVGKCGDGYKPGELHPGTWKMDNGGLWYPADGTLPSTPISPRGKTRPSIFMPRWASRLTLEVTGIRVEPVQGITNQDALAEGIDGLTLGQPPRIDFASLWNFTNGEGAWDRNDWVWVVEFRKVD